VSATIARTRRRPPIELLGQIVQIGVLQQAVRDHEADFAAETWRQDTPGTAHSFTETIYLRMPPVINLHSVFESLECEDTPAMDEPVFRATVRALATMIGKRPARAMIVRLQPERAIAPHIDEGLYARSTLRYHLTISAADAQLVVAGATCTPRPGDLHFFDKSQRHYATNHGRTPRDHLILDCWK
jgi:hypothetical protein